MRLMSILKSHLRDIRDRSVLRLFESDGIAGMPGTLGVPGGNMLPSHWEDQSYFSEPEFDSEFQHQHIHKSKDNICDYRYKEILIVKFLEKILLHCGLRAILLAKDYAQKLVTKMS
ncbi:hypothetical protein TSAR_013907 [Trichomalopsis sarcophagae]|uniref:Uncharacterized protein n=1 Tax=Trichomalopsis sarcophagae TaxID=543379 RepID=A0A232FL34_9HYME|nr:hypothetical protein TSAR_013907 [Trichomalopsis sarcophagae]